MGSSGGGANLGGLESQAIQEGSQRIQQNYSDLGLGPSGQNWSDPTGRYNTSSEAAPAFPSGTPFAGQTPGFPAGTASGTLPTATATDLANWPTQVMAGFAPVVDQANQMAAQAQQQKAQSTGSLIGAGAGKAAGGL